MRQHPPPGHHSNFRHNRSHATCTPLFHHMQSALPRPPTMTLHNALHPTMPCIPQCHQSPSPSTPQLSKRHHPSHPPLLLAIRDAMITYHDPLQSLINPPCHQKITHPGHLLPTLPSCRDARHLHIPASTSLHRQTVPADTQDPPFSQAIVTLAHGHPGACRHPPWMSPCPAPLITRVTPPPFFILTLHINTHPDIPPVLPKTNTAQIGTFLPSPE